MILMRRFLSFLSLWGGAAAPRHTSEDEGWAPLPSGGSLVDPWG